DHRPDGSGGAMFRTYGVRRRDRPDVSRCSVAEDKESSKAPTIALFLELLEQLILKVQSLDMGDTPKLVPGPPPWEEYLRQHWMELDPTAGLDGKPPPIEEFIKHHRAA